MQRKSICIYAETLKTGHLKFCNLVCQVAYSIMKNMFLCCVNGIACLRVYECVCLYSDVSKGLPHNLNLTTNIDFCMAMTDRSAILFVVEGRVTGNKGGKGHS